MEKKNKNDKEMRYMQFGNLEVRESDGEGSKVRTIAGYVTKYNKESQILRDWWGDEFIEVVAEGAFNESLERNIIKALWNHDTNLVLGSTKNNTLRLTSDNIGLKFELDLPENTWGNDAWESIQRGDVDGVSFGFRVLDDKWSETEKEGKKILKRTLLKIDLYEISPTPFPAYLDSEVSCRSLEKYREKRKKEEEKRSLVKDLEKFDLQLELFKMQ
ncbi:HK97 family phage prohead protease [Caminicella sporogenes]|uniref:HK97 family phage prohead protease n=1 Tax=Caminicella sporogenes TaxID=166485 RepID=UPI002541509E|nr:HK97 family phage prohead protease [Caminicella sporogenes]WIF95129.1 HK97 family phage prohead protease [Caminicella sporogenes]